MPALPSSTSATTEKVYSYSRLMTFEHKQANVCLRKSYYKYIQCRPEPSGLPAKIGKILQPAMNKNLTVPASKAKSKSKGAKSTKGRN